MSLDESQETSFSLPHASLNWFKFLSLKWKQTRVSVHAGGSWGMLLQSAAICGFKEKWRYFNNLHLKSGSQIPIVSADFLKQAPWQIVR